MFTKVTLHFRFLEPDDETPAKGRVTFTLSTALQDSETNEIIAPVTKSVRLVDGEGSLVMVATNDPTTQPTGATIRVTESISRAEERSYDIALDKDTPDAQLADLAPVVSTASFAYALVSTFNAHLADTTAHTAANTVFVATELLPVDDVQAAIELAATLGEGGGGAEDGTVVHLAGAETISGAKNFTGGLTIASVTAETTTGAQAKADAAKASAISQILGGLPETLLDTILELAVQLRADESAAASLATLVATKVDKTTLDANSVLVADTDDTPVARTMGASTVLARLASGAIVAATPAQLRAILDTELARSVGGGFGILRTVSASGTTQTVDVSIADWHDITLTGNCAISFSGATAGRTCWAQLLLRQDGTGGRGATFPSISQWIGTSPSIAGAAAALTVVVAVSEDGGSTWIGFGDPPLIASNPEDASTVVAATVFA